MQADKEGLIVDQIFKLAAPLSKDARLSLAVILTKGDDRVKVIEPENPLTSCGHSPYDPCHNCDDANPR